MSKLLLCLVSFYLCGAQAFAMTITSNAPGNIFTAESPIKLSIKDAQGDVDYEVVDYFGGKVAAAKTVGKVELPALDPGWYQIKCRDSVEEVTTSIGVVMNRGNASLPVDGRVCTDVAGTWLVKQNCYKLIAEMIRMAGIPWVRERLSWRETEPEPGKIDWNKYQTIADTYKAEGINVYQIWHDSPVWSHPGRKGKFCPDDLRDLYRFTRTAASHFSSQVQVWEIWNEPDNAPFYPGLSDRYSGMAKAAYLGFKDGNPHAIVLQGSMCLGVTNFMRGIYECGSADYYDVFNWHIYNNPSVYPDVLALYLDVIRPYNAADRPIWLTEAGFVVKGTEGPKNRLLSSENQRRQCRFIPRSIVMSLIAGTDRHFYFVLPDFTNGVMQRGALHPDLTPYPSFPALSAVANILGQSTYKGEYKQGNAAVTAQVFSVLTGNVLIAWSDAEAEITVPTDKKTIRIANIFGDESNLASKNGAVRIKVGPEAIYLLDIGKPIEKELTGKPRPHGKLPKLNPSHVVVMGYTGLPTQKAADAYIITGQDVFTYTVEVYNFREKAGAMGTVEVAAPDGWTVENAKRSVTLDAMGRAVLSFRVKPGKPGVGRYKLTVRGNFRNDKVDPCVSSFNFNLTSAIPAQQEPLSWAKDAALWQPNISSNGKVVVSNPETNKLRIYTSFKQTGDRWAYPILKFQKPLDMSNYDGVAFDLNVTEGDPDSFIRIMFMEPNGSQYLDSIGADPGKRRVVFLFSNLNIHCTEEPKPDKRFDSNAVSAIKLGCNTKRDHIVFDASNFELVKF